MEAAAQSLFHCLEQIPDPRQARGVRHPFQAILRLTLPGLVSGQTTMAHIAWYGRLHWETLRSAFGGLGFVRDQAPHPTTRSRTLAGVPLAGVPLAQLQQAVSDWAAGLASDQARSAAVDGKWAKQSTRIFDQSRGRQSVGDGERAGSRPEIVPGPVAPGRAPLRILDQSCRRCCGVSWVRYLSVIRGCPPRAD